MANNGLNIKFEIEGLDELAKQMERAGRELDKNLKQGMKEYSALAEEGSRALAHRDSGDLEASIHADPIRSSTGKVEGAVASNLSYALRRHEEPVRKGSHDKYDNGSKFSDYYVDGRGERTRQKASWRGEKPGRKFMGRAVRVTEKDFDAIFAKALEKTLRG